MEALLVYFMFCTNIGFLALGFWLRTFFEAASCKKGNKKPTCSTTASCKKGNEELTCSATLPEQESKEEKPQVFFELPGSDVLHLSTDCHYLKGKQYRPLRICKSCLKKQ